MTNPFAERLRNNDRIETTSSELPSFPGMFTAFNGNSGAFSMMAPGSDIKDAQDVKSMQFITHFTMTRLKFSPTQNEKYLSNYVIGGENIPYLMTYNGVNYIANTGKEMAAQLGLRDTSLIKQEQVYVGYIVNLDGAAQPQARAVWYVSRGVNAYLLNDALKDNGGLQARTLIKMSSNGATRKNNSGGTNMVLDFDVSQLSEEKVDSFIKWSDNAAQIIEQYRLDMIEASNRLVDAARNMPNDPEAAFLANATQYSAPAAPVTPQGMPQQAPTSFPANNAPMQQNAPVQGVNPFTGQPIGAPSQEVVIDEDDLPF